MGAIRDSIENWAKLSNVRRWQAAFGSEHGPHATTRHILLTLAMRMDSKTGDRQFPGVRELERRTGLSQRTIIDRLDQADEQGWIRRLVVRRRRTKCRQYLPAIPGEVLKEVQHLEARLISEGAEALSAPRGAESPSGGAELLAEGAEGNSGEVLKEVQPSSSVVVQRGSKVVGREDGESLKEEVEVPADFDPAEHGLDDNKKLFGLLTDGERQWAAAILTHETDYALPPDSEVSRSYELEKLPPHRRRVLQYRHNGEATS